MPPMTTRNAAIDVYRCLLMMGISLLHCITQGGHNIPWAANSLEWCVTGFAVISGWFGVRFSPVKLFKLYAMSLYCAIVISFVNAVAGIGGFSVREVWSIAVGQWYLNAYAVLMCCAPVLNEGCKSVKVISPIVLCAFGWSFATTLPVIREIVPHTAGLEAYSFMTLIGTYCVARILRQRKEHYCRLWRGRQIAVSVLAISLLIAALGLGDYNSPFALLIAATSFYLVKSVQFPAVVGRTCSLLGPSMFCVYLLQSSGCTWWAIQRIEDAMLGVGLPLFLTFICASIVLFAVCVAIDIPRRLLARWL